MALRVIDRDEARWQDARGWGMRPFAALGRAQGVPDCHVVSLRPGAVRGNHSHPAGTEWLLVCGGPVTVAWREPGRAPERMSVKGDAPVLVEIDPGTAHAFRNDGEGDAWLVAFSDVASPPTERCDPLL